MLRTPQAAVVLLSFVIFTTLDCWDWWLGRFYSFLDRHLQADHHKQAADPTSYPPDSSAEAELEAGENHTRQQLTVCLCKRLAESGRARRLQAIRDGKWHKCSCWGWELGSQQNGLDAQVSGGSGARKPHLPAEVDPLAGAPDFENPSIQKARNSSSLQTSKEAPLAGQTWSSFHVHEAGGLAKPGARSSSAEAPTGRKHSHRRSKKKRAYVGRWTDCQCAHCTEVRTQRHRQLFVRVIGRGVNKPSGANGHIVVDVNGGPGENGNGYERQSAIRHPDGNVNKPANHGVNGFWEGSVNGHFEEGVNGRFGGVNGHLGGTVNEHLGGSANGPLEKIAKGHVRGSANGLIGRGVNGLLEESANGHLRGSANGHLSGGVNGRLTGGANGPPKSSVNRPWGAKPDLLFIHGYCASSNFWADTVFPHLPPALLESRRVFAPDLLGTGKSPRPHDCHYTLRDHVEALEAVLAAHDVRTFHVIGHSMGSLMAVVLAARNVSRVLSVTLFSPMYADMDRGDPPCEALLDIWAPGRADRWGRVPRVLWQRTLSSIPRWYLNFHRFNTHVLYGQHTLLENIIPRLLPTLPASFVSDFLRDTWDVQLHMFNNTLVAGGHALDSAYQVLADANLRILVDHGTADPTCPFEGSEALARKYANVELRRCEQADHLHVVAGREREVVVEIVEEIARAERKRRLSGKDRSA